MPGKMAGSGPRPGVRVSRVLVAVSTPPLSCKRAGKTRTLMPVWDSSGESRFRQVSLKQGSLLQEQEAPVERNLILRYKEALTTTRLPKGVQP